LRLLQPELEKLPPPPGHAGLQVSPDSVLHKVASHRLLPERKLAQKSAALKLASAAASSRGVVLDYSLLTSQTNQFTFAGDTTYYVSGPVTLSANTVVEGGTVIKFTNSPAASISLGSSLACQTGPYKMAILTSKADNTVGETI